MKFRGLIVAALVLLILGGVYYWSEHHKTTETAAKPADGPPTILKLDQASISKLEVKKRDKEPVVLEKTAGGDWRITQPKALGADQDQVMSMTGALASLDSERLVEDKASDLKRYGLDQPGLEVNITEKDNKTQKLLLGDNTPTGSAVYAALAGDPRVFTLAFYNKTKFDKGLDDLRDKRLLTVSADKISRIELTRKNQTVDFGRDKDTWQILKPQPARADSSQVDELARKLSDARMESASEEQSKDAASAFAKGTPIATARVTGPSGIQDLEVRKNKDAYYAKSSVVEGVFKVGSDLGQALEKAPEDFRNKKLFDLGFDEPNKIEWHNGAKVTVLTRAGEDWLSDGKKLDAATVWPLVGKLRELAAGKFVTSGFGTPEIQLAVTSNDGKRVEKVSVAKSADGYIAKRENEPALYQLESSAIDDIQTALDALKPAAVQASTTKK
jgi:hypothetical protein